MSDKKPIGRLVYRPSFIEGEGLYGYMLRLAEGNGLSGIKHLVHGGAADINALANCLGLDASHSSLNSFVRQSVNEGKVAYRVWNKHTARFCPECLSQTSVWQQAWDLTLLTACPTHGCRLVSRCEKCGAEFHWRRRQLMTCKCGADMRMASAPAASSEVIEVARWLCAKLSEQGSVPEYLELLSLEQLHQLLIFIGAYAQADRDGRRMKIQRLFSFETATALMDAAAPVITRWPDGLHELFDDVQARYSGSTTATRLPARFGSFYTYLFKTFREVEFGSVIHAFESYLEKHWELPLANRNRFLSSTLRRKHTWVSASVLAKELNTSRPKLLRFHEDGLIAGHRYKTASGRSIFCVDRREIKVIQGLIKDLIDQQTACELLGVQKFRVKQLSEHQLLGRAIVPDKKKYGAWTLSKKHVEMMPYFGGRFEPVSESTNPELISLHFALKYKFRTPELFPRLVIAVIEEKLKPKGMALEHRGIAAWLFDRQELDSWVEEQRRLLRKGAMTIRQAAKVLGLKEEVAYQLVRLCVLVSTEESDGEHTLFSLNDLDVFKGRYVLTNEIAARLGMDRPATIPRYLEERGIFPYLDPKKNGCRQYVYKRTPELENLMRN